MRRLTLKELAVNGAAFVGVSTFTVDMGMAVLEQAGFVDLPWRYYLLAPMAAWTAVGIPASITLAERLLRQTDSKPGRISAHLEGATPPPGRSIPFTANGRRGTLMASTQRHIFGETLPEVNETYHPAIWRVPVPPDNDVTVRESELRAFLEAAWKRDKYQFSRRYWTRKRRPPLWRGKYEAFMRLLVEAGLVEGRHANGGASGRLVVFPREAVTFLKYESAFRAV